MNIIQKYSYNFINILFVTIVLSLSIMSIFWHCEIDMNTYDQIKTITSNRPIIYMVATILLFILIYFISIYLNKIIEPKKMFILTSVFIIFASIVWIFFNDTLPHSDQRIIYEEARKIIGINPAPYDHFYMTAYKRQRGIVLLMSLLMKICGDSQIPFRFYNIISLTLLLYGTYKLVLRFISSRISLIFASFFILLFYPFIIYTCYLYGTLSAVSFEVLAFYCILDYIETGSIQKGITSAFCFVFGVFMHQSALIGIIAACLMLLILTSRTKVTRTILVLSIIISLYIISSFIINSLYEYITQSPKGDELPAINTIYMGLTADTSTGSVAGPGSSDSSEMIIYINSGKNSDNCNSTTKLLLSKVLVEYISGDRDIVFFFNKIRYQWLDPSFDAHRIILLNNPANNEPPNSPMYTAFYYSRIRIIALRVLNIFLILVYILSSIGVLNDLISNKSLISFNVLSRLFIIGGFSFQLIWESLSRYCFSYYVLLIIQAIYGFATIEKYLQNFSINKVKRFFMRQNT